jgi:hypothetical protein
MRGSSLVAWTRCTIIAKMRAIISGFVRSHSLHARKCASQSVRHDTHTHTTHNTQHTHTTHTQHTHTMPTGYEEVCGGSWYLARASSLSIGWSAEGSWPTQRDLWKCAQATCTPRPCEPNTRRVVCRRVVCRWSCRVAKDRAPCGTLRNSSAHLRSARNRPLRARPRCRWPAKVILLLNIIKNKK